MPLTRPRAVVVTLLALAAWAVHAASPVAPSAAEPLPDRLADQDFWALSERLSEPNGFFRSDNLLSNEIYFQYQVPELVKRARQGGVYLGVGPEQNFTYIAALHPKMVFITDIRRGNLWTQLMYKALFEMSADRADFVSRLFTKPRPAGLTAQSTAKQIFDAYWDVNTSSEAVFKKNSQDILDWLTKKRKLPLAEEDQRGIINDVYYHFYWFGLLINYNSSSGGRGGNYVSYYDLMVATDGAGVERSFLANEENFQVLKQLEERNLIVPVVGNFGGPRALRDVGQYVRDHGATVSAFYLSNVEQYLQQDGFWDEFCANVASMPLDASSTFIRSSRGGGFSGGGGGLVNSLGSMLAETKGCAR